MIAQPAATSSGNEVEQELILLRAKVENALQRISHLEQKSRPALFPIDSPAMIFARELCAQYFPGPVEVEIASAPDDPESKWYTFIVRGQGSTREVVDKEAEVFKELDRQYPVEAMDIRLAVVFE
ncbi:hypothetical protein [Anatilimnocola floriformis]|uniref:hypothetical protein n=1 Tax=Anatilimnocola floriformis TaxID=2948575 RepID=UPI0020C397DE|nr:hypothetical protein [Anatilimnocola floriformis]